MELWIAWTDMSSTWGRRGYNMSSRCVLGSNRIIYQRHMLDSRFLKDNMTMVSINSNSSSSTTTHPKATMVMASIILRLETITISFHPISKTHTNRRSKQPTRTRRETPVDSRISTTNHLQNGSNKKDTSTRWTVPSFIRMERKRKRSRSQTRLTTSSSSASGTSHNWGKERMVKIHFRSRKWISSTSWQRWKTESSRRSRSRRRTQGFTDGFVQVGDGIQSTTKMPRATSFPGSKPLPSMECQTHKKGSQPTQPKARLATGSQSVTLRTKANQKRIGAQYTLTQVDIRTQQTRNNDSHLQLTSCATRISTPLTLETPSLSRASQRSQMSSSIWTNSLGLECFFSLKVF